MQRIEIDILDGQLANIRFAVPAPARGLANAYPIGRLVHSALKSVPLNEGLQNMHGVSIFRYPVGGYPAADERQNVAR
jgi:hypothetical protein